MIWTSSSGFITLAITKKQAAAASHPGPCDADVLALSNEPRIRRQLGQLNQDDVRIELQGYGAWEDHELADHEQNLQRILWLACGDIVEGSV